MIALVDCNNFYASCERVFNPKLKNKPIIVLSNNDGCVIARSNEAKSLGIKMGEPVFKKKEEIKKYKIHVYSINFALYGDMSNRIFSILLNDFSETEIYSIDEAFINFNGIRFPKKEALKIRKKILKYTGIPVSIGIGKTKTLAKLAGNIAKKKKNGVYVIKNKRTRMEAFKRQPIENVWGIGKKRATFLYKYKIYNVIDFMKADNDWVRKKMSTTVLKTQKELFGQKQFLLEKTPERRKSICTSRTFLKETKNIQVLTSAISTYTMKCAEKLRKEKCNAGYISIFIGTNPFKENHQSCTKGSLLNVSTNDSIELVKEAIRLLKSIYKPNQKYKKAGVIMGKIRSTETIQTNLFDSIENRKKRRNLMKSIDIINKRIGKEKIKIGIQGETKNRKIQQQNRSPCYTTKWKDLLSVM